LAWNFSKDETPGPTYIPLFNEIKTYLKHCDNGSRNILFGMARLLPDYTLEVFEEYIKEEIELRLHVLAIRTARLARTGEEDVKNWEGGEAVMKREKWLIEMFFIFEHNDRKLKSIEKSQESEWEK
jgi:hypothetical protein